jgi:hypothetical protein
VTDLLEWTIDHVAELVARDSRSRRGLHLTLDVARSPDSGSCLEVLDCGADDFEVRGGELGLHLRKHVAFFFLDVVFDGSFEFGYGLADVLWVADLFDAPDDLLGFCVFLFGLVGQPASPLTPSRRAG